MPIVAFEVLCEGCPQTLVAPVAITEKPVGVTFFLPLTHFNILVYILTPTLYMQLLPANIFLSGVTDIIILAFILYKPVFNIYFVISYASFSFASQKTFELL